MKAYAFAPLTEGEIETCRGWFAFADMGGLSFPDAEWTARINAGPWPRAWSVSLGAGMIGYVLAEPAVQGSEASVALAVAPQARGQGHAAWILRAFLDDIFMGQKKVAAFVGPGNAAALRVLEKAGFHSAGNVPDRDGMMRYLYERLELQLD